MNTEMNHANSYGWEEKNEDQSLYLLISYSVAFYTMGWENLLQDFELPPGERWGEHIASDI